MIMNNKNSIVPSEQLPENFMAGDSFSDVSLAAIVNEPDLNSFDLSWVDSLGNGECDDIKSSDMYIISKNGELLECSDNDEVAMVKAKLDNVQETPSYILGETCATEELGQPFKNFNPFSPSLSLLAWPGELNFSIKINDVNKTNKWRYSTKLRKLYVRPSEAVPVSIKMSPWIQGGTVNITPVYVASQHSTKPVIRCFNHKQADIDKRLENTDHLVQVESSEAKYRFRSSRYSVDTPVTSPPPGQDTFVVYVKCVCLSSCNAGTVRKPFCLVFTLFDSLGRETGRQILDLKVCSCPVRDCENKEAKFHLANEKKRAAQNRSSEVKSSKSFTKKQKIAFGSSEYEQISVPVEIAAQVKEYANLLVAAKCGKEAGADLPFPGY